VRFLHPATSCRQSWSGSRFGHGRRPRSNTFHLSPISDFELQAGIGRAGRLNKRLKVSWLGTPFLKRRNLSRKSCLARAKIATSTAVRPNPGCPPDRRKAAERGKMDGFDAVLLNRKDHQKTEIYSISVRGIFDEYHQIWSTIPLMSSPPDGTRSKPGRDRHRCVTAYLKMARRKAQ
jgi:hypothetical protein